MRKLSSTALAGAALAVAWSTSGFAADLPSRRAPPVYVPPPVAPPVFTWTGLYVGGQVGYEFGTDHARAVAPGVGLLAASSASETGVIGGAHVGYNYQTPGLPFLGGAYGASLVFGLEGDVDGTSARATNVLGTITATNTPTVQGSARGRLGVAFGRALFYATGGAAFGGFDNNYVNALNGLTDSSSQTRVGYTVGGGVEYAFTNNWSVRVEYRRTDFGRSYDNLVNSTGGGVNVLQRDVDNRVQAGFSYKFDMFAPSPVVAKY